jgi:hypothetical protein
MYFDTLMNKTTHRSLTPFLGSIAEISKTRLSCVLNQDRPASCASRSLNITGVGWVSVLDLTISWRSLDAQMTNQVADFGQ